MGKKKILIVDDSASSLSLISGILSGEGYKLLVAKNLFKAYRIIQENDPDILLLDLLFPHEHGFTILKKLKKSNEYQHIPVIIISADNDPETIKKALHLGAIDYLTKPLNWQVLKNKIWNHFYNQRTKNNPL
ncbi:MAG: response regulator [Bacteroidales bacterium]|jgi:putative two-component system response regulator|nr:response regulator [Bacteroidales bacterium]